MSSRFLMCPPQYFDIAYIINPWMQGNIAQVKKSLARAQWQGLYDALMQHADVKLIEPVDGLPDMVFTANAGLILGNSVVLSRFRYPERQGEEKYFAQWFEQQGFTTYALPEELPFEGAGDALLDRRLPLLWIGYGHRSGIECAQLIQDWLKIDVQLLHLNNARFYHLDTCFCPLPDGYLMYYPPAFDAASRAHINERIAPALQIILEEEDALAFACNAVVAGRQIFLNQASLALQKVLEERGFSVHQTPLTEFMRAGGSAKCLSLRLDEECVATNLRAESVHA